MAASLPDSSSGSSFLDISPDKELQFRRPFSTVTKQSLTIINSHPDSAIAFKVRTTTPKQYCVRPNSGRLPPGGRCEVSVLLQAMKEDPPLSAKCRDKFLVLGIKISNDVMALEGDALQASLLALWAQADTAKAATNGAVNGATNGSDGTDGTAAAALHNPIVERKLRCSFLPPAHSPSPSMLPSTATPLVDPTTAKSDFHDARETVSVGGVLASEGLRSNYPVQSASASTIVGSTLEQDLTDAREKIHSLQSACEAYKIEIERISQVRLRRAEASGHSLTTDSTAVNGLAATRVKKDTISLTMLITAVLIAFLAGIYLF